MFSSSSNSASSYNMPAWLLTWTVVEITIALQWMLWDSISYTVNKPILWTVPSYPKQGVPPLNHSPSNSHEIFFSLTSPARESQGFPDLLHQQQWLTLGTETLVKVVLIAQRCLNDGIIMKRDTSTINHTKRSKITELSQSLPRSHSHLKQ